jgi:hypothetical protein
VTGPERCEAHRLRSSRLMRRGVWPIRTGRRRCGRRCWKAARPAESDQGVATDVSRKPLPPIAPGGAWPHLSRACEAGAPRRGASG